MKKMISAMLATLLLLTCCLTACGGGGGADTTTLAPTEGEGTTAPVSEGTTTFEGTTTAAPTDTTTAAEEVKNPEARAKDKTYNILFIGNSYTYYNNMPTALFAPIAKAAGYQVRVNAVTEGGHHLWEFASESDEFGQAVRKLLAAQKFDVVVVQEQSHTPISNPERFYTGARDLYAMVKAHNSDAEMVLYATWGYQTGHESLTKYGKNTQEMEMKLRAAYTAIGEELGIEVAYVGAGMTYALENSSVGLYNADRTHPSLAGSAIAAWTIFSTIFRVHPDTVDHSGDITPSVLTTVKAAAAHVYETDIKVDDAYKTTSVGVAYVEPTYDSGIDITKTQYLTAFPASGIISHVSRDSAEEGNGWVKYKSDAAKTFSGLRGDKDAISSKAYSATGLTDAQKADIADIGYGVSVIGIGYMRADKKGTETAVENLVNGHWGSSYMAAMTFDGNKYDINGNAVADGKYAGLITLNFGSIHTFDAIGYMSGSLLGFPQVQEVFVSDDGVNWTRVESACYDTLAMDKAGQSLASVATKVSDPWNNNKATVQCFFGMGGVSGKYIRLGICLGGDVDSVGIHQLPAMTQTINTREIVVYGTKN